MPKYSLRTRAAIFAGRTASRLSALLGRGSGGMIGGKVAEKIQPAILRELSQGKKIAIVTGTNGKSTTTRMLATAVSSSGSVPAWNNNGDNMTAGVIAALLKKPYATYATLEVDEMHVPSIAHDVKPHVLVYLNLSRDQLDRVGEITSIAERLKRAVAENPQALVIANCDDPLITYAAWDSRENHTVWVNAGSPWVHDSVSSPASHAVIVREGENWYSAPLPGFENEGIDFSRPHPDFTFHAANADSPSAFLTGSPVIFKPCSEKFSELLSHHAHTEINLPGRANRSNALMAFLAARALGITEQACLAGISHVREVAGRYGHFEWKGHSVRLLLAKNPAGWQESLTMIDAQASGLVVAVNGQEADGVDLSWLWDVDFSQLHGHVHASGERGRDLQVRLQYAGHTCGFFADPLRAVENLPQGRVDVLANYTAFRDLLAHVKHLGIYEEKSE